MIKATKAVLDVINPIIEGMTKIFEANKHARPIIGGGQYDNERITMCKRDCVHVILDSQTGKFVLAAKKTNEGKLVCAACGKEISTEFGEDAQQTLVDAEKIINQIVIFGMMNGLHVEPLKTLISIKHVWPDIIKLSNELGEFANRSSTSSDSLGDIGKEYIDTTGNSITSMR